MVEGFQTELEERSFSLGSFDVLQFKFLAYKEFKFLEKSKTLCVNRVGS